jgi:hypothetical protein
MPLQILPREGSFWGTLGQSIGTGLGEGLGALAQHKVEQMRQKQFSDTYGKEAADLLKVLSPEERKIALQNPEGLRALSLIGQQQQGPQQQNEGGLNAFQNVNQQQNPMDILRNDMAQPIGMQQSKANILGNIFKTPQQRMMEERVNLEKERNEIAKQKAHNVENKETREFLKPFYEQAEAARKNKRDYQVILDAANSGELRAGPLNETIHQGLERIGLKNFNKNFTTQLFDKTIARLSQNIKADFGDARVTNFLESVYQRSLPSLWNTPEAIIAIAEIGSLGSDIAILKEEAANAVAQMNNGKIPYDAYSRIHQQIGQKVEEIEKKIYAIGNNMEAMATSKGGNRKNIKSVQEKARKNPLAYPHLFKEGATYKGKIIRNGKWENQ